MKTMSIVNILFSIIGIILSIFNWILFTEQLPGNISSTNLPNGNIQVEFYRLVHHEHSISLLAILIFLFLFNLVYSIFNLVFKLKKIN